MADFTVDGQFLRAVLWEVARADVHDCLWWSAAPGRLVFLFVNCTGLFNTAAGDLEAITADRLDAFRKAFADAAEVTGGDRTWAPLLYVCRMREARPLQSAYPSDDRLWPLVDACGPDAAVPAEPGPDDFVVLR